MLRNLILLSLLFIGGCGGSSDTPPQPSFGSWNWISPLPQDNTLNAIAHDGNMFVAVGYGGTVITSPDGKSWTVRHSGTNSRLNGIAFGTNALVAVGDDGTILTSPDGVEWTDRSGALQPLIPLLWEATFANGRFVASGVFATYIYTFASRDGVEWTMGEVGVHAVTYANGMFLGVRTFFPMHGYYPSSQAVVTSADGLAWTAVSKPNWPFYIVKIVYGKGLYVGVGGTGSGPVIITSPDGVTWTERNAGTAEALFGLAYGNGFFVAVGNNGTILISSDGIYWTSSRQAYSGSLNSVTYGNGVFTVVGSNGVILQSDRW